VWEVRQTTDRDSLAELIARLGGGPAALDVFTAVLASESGWLCVLRLDGTPVALCGVEEPLGEPAESPPFGTAFRIALMVADWLMANIAAEASDRLIDAWARGVVAPLAFVRSACCARTPRHRALPCRGLDLAADSVVGFDQRSAAAARRLHDRTGGALCVAHRPRRRLTSEKTSRKRWLRFEPR